MQLYIKACISMNGAMYHRIKTLGTLYNIIFVYNMIY